MKIIKSWLITLGMAIIFTSIALNCANIRTSGTDNDMTLEGIWLIDDGEKFTLHNGNFEMSPFRGTYSTSGNNFSLIITHVYTHFEIENINLPPNWFTKEQLLAEVEFILTELCLSEEDISEEDIAETFAALTEYLDVLFPSRTGTYSVSGNTLAVTIDSETNTFTRNL